MDKKKKVEIESEVFKRLVKHFQKRTDIQNIDLMNLANFCRNCSVSYTHLRAHET